MCKLFNNNCFAYPTVKTWSTSYIKIIIASNAVLSFFNIIIVCLIKSVSLSMGIFVETIKIKFDRRKYLYNKVCGVS